MNVAVFDSHSYDRASLERANRAERHRLLFFTERLRPETVSLAQGVEAVCVFVNDQLSREVLTLLRAQGVRLIALRCAGFNQVDVAAAAELGLSVVRVPLYSPEAVAEHALALILTLNRKTHLAYERVRVSNFSLEGLEGFTLQGKTIGVIGTGKIGAAFLRIMKGLGGRLLAYDPYPDERLAQETGARYVPLEQLYRESRIISLHLPLSPETKHLIDQRALSLMQENVMLINTSRGGLIDTSALVEALKQHRVGAAGLDVYEEEAGVFFEDWSGEVLQDDVLARLLTLPNVLMTSHQAFLTHEALDQIAEVTLANLDSFAKGETLINAVPI
jgi:D-lactate dehydrogenase